MPINVISKIKPANGGQFPVVEDVDMQGGLQVRATTADRDSIPTANRKAGMLVYVIANNTFYHLSGGIANSNWATVLGTPATLIFRFNAVSGGNVYGTWGEIVAARANIAGPAVIVVDDSISSPAIANVSMDLKNNTALVGFRNSELRPGSQSGGAQLSIANGIILNNPSDFYELHVFGNSSADVAFRVAAPSTQTNINLYNTVIDNNISGGSVFDVSEGGNINLFGTSRLNNPHVAPPILFANGFAVGPLFLNMYDAAVVDNDTISTTSTSYQVNVNIVDGGAFFNTSSQSLFNGLFFFNGGTLNGPYSNWGGASTGSVLTKFSNAAASWGTSFSAQMSFPGGADLTAPVHIGFPAGIADMTWDNSGNWQFVGIGGGVFTASPGGFTFQQGFNSVNSRYRGGSTTTPNATPLLIQPPIFVIGGDSSYSLELDIVGVLQNGSESAQFKITMGYLRRTGGPGPFGIVDIGTPTIVTSRNTTGAASWAVTLVKQVGQEFDVLLRLTGASAQVNWTWELKIITDSLL